VGAFLRFGWQEDSAAIQYESIISGGLDINGRYWRRGKDNVGIGFSYIDGGNLDTEHTRVAEVYWRTQLNDAFAFTLDAQYIHETLRAGGGDQDGFIPGVRLVAVF
jgi:porin